MTNAYTAPLLRAFKQAPWRTQTQAVALWSVTLLVIIVLGGLYLAVAARAGTAGRDVQDLEWRKAELTRANDQLRATLSHLRSVTRLSNRARELGYQPVVGEQVEYLPVANYPTIVQTQTPVQASADEMPVAATTDDSWVQAALTWLAPPPAQSAQK